MSNNFHFRSQHFSGESKCLKWLPSEVGLKAYGLAQLPITWTPPFVVLTTSAFYLWKNQASREEMRSSFAPGLSPILDHESERIIVRSSALAENIECRGWLESVQCHASYEDVLNAADRVWTRAKDTPGIASDGFGLVVQQFRNPKLHGHLSNERRVSRNRDVWLCEVESPMAVVETKIIRFRAKSTSLEIDKSLLSCSTQEQLVHCLKDVAIWCMNQEDRNHLEWVWDGRHLWIVQHDKDLEVRGERPACSPIPLPLLSVEQPVLKVFVPSEKAKSWNKMESLRVFASAGMTVANLYVLENRKVITTLSAGKVSTTLKADLKAILQSPIVFRTDFLTEGRMPKLLSLRSHTLSTLQDASSWLVEMTVKIISEGIKADEFCFIAHRYIPAKSGAICLAHPKRSQVRIDAIWGFPDGLLCFPHDTFYVAPDGQSKIDRHIRCKPFCLSEDSQGNWEPNKCPAPWDWKSCLEDSEVREIAKMSHTVAAHLNQSVGIMFFVGVDDRTGYPPILPWIHFVDTPTAKEETDHFHYAGKSFTISSSADLNRLEPSIIQARKTEKVALHLRPAPNLLRDKDFVETIADAAIRLAVPVQLEGSILSHIYYMLTKRGVKVRCIDAIAAPRHLQRFGKLVRDFIDVKIRAGGEIARTVQVPKDELVKLLKAKALEEAFELFRAEDPSLAFEELADILEVVISACKAYGRSFEELNEFAAQKRQNRGGFEKGIFLVETEAVPLFSNANVLPSLFGAEDLSDSSSGMHSRKSAHKTYSFSTTRRPRLRGTGIAVPMIPPHPSETNVTTVIPLPDEIHEAVIRYTTKEILVQLRKKPPVAPNPNQMQFEFK